MLLIFFNELFFNIVQFTSRKLKRLMFLLFDGHCPFCILKILSDFVACYHRKLKRKRLSVIKDISINRKGF